MAGSRGHEVIPHTADVGLRAWAPSIEALFDEAARGLAELTLGEPVTSRPARSSISERVELEAGDLAGLAYAWLNELIGLGEINRAVAVATEDLRVAAHGPVRLIGRVALERFDALGGPPARHLKAATFHGLTIDRTGDGWTLVAYLDV